MTVTSDTAVPLRHTDRFFIDGQWVTPSTGSTFDVIDSSTEQVYFRVPEAQPADIDRAVTAARRAFDEGPWPTLSHRERAEFLTGLANGLRRSGRGHRADLAPRVGGPLRHGHAWRRRYRRQLRLLRRAGRDLPLRGAGPPADGRVRPAGAGAGGRGRGHHPVERPHRTDHLQAGPRPPGRVHGGAQVLARGPGRCLRGGGDRRVHRPAGRGAERGHRRSGGLRTPGPRCTRGQDHLHRLDGGRSAHRLHLR